MDYKVIPPKAPEGFWEKYSAHVSTIELHPFEMEEIGRMVEAYGSILEANISFNKNKALKERLLLEFKNDLITRTHRAHLFEKYLVVKDYPQEN